MTSAAFALRRRTRARWLTVLSYHRVARPELSYPFDAEVVDATPEELDAQMRTVAASCTPIRLATLYAHLEHGEPLPPSPVLVTFDDGYRECHDVALPILKRHGVPAVFFVATRFITERRLFWWDRLAWIAKRTRKTAIEVDYPAALRFELGDVPRAIEKLTRVVKATKGIDPDRFVAVVEAACEVAMSREEEQRWARDLLMTWDDVRALAAAGMDVESHTSSHRVMATLSAADIEEELATSRDDLERELGHVTRAVAYPCGKLGDALPDVREAARRTGYAIGFCNADGVNRLGDLDPLALRRVGLDRGIPESMFRAMVAIPRLSRRG